MNFPLIVNKDYIQHQVNYSHKDKRIIQTCKESIKIIFYPGNDKQTRRCVKHPLVAAGLFQLVSLTLD